MPEREPRELVGEVERRLAEVEALPEPAAREAAVGAVQALLELYGAGLERIVEEVALVDDGQLARSFTGDELISHLLLLHGLHPVPLSERVREALGEVRPYLESHGGDVELVGVSDGQVRLRLQGSCSGCPSSTMTLKLAIENAIHKAAPEIEEVLAEDLAPPTAASGLLQIELPGGSGHPGSAVNGASPTLVGTGAPTRADGEWTTVGTLRGLDEATPMQRQVGDRQLLFIRLAAGVYAYASRCPACEASLARAAVEGTALACPGCGGHYDVLRAGRGLDQPQLHLEPVPLLTGEDELVRVALPIGTGA